MTKVEELVNEIRTNHKQVSSSQKDEVAIMQAMMNDTSYEVGVYGTKGKVDTYKPAESFKTFGANLLSTAAKIPKEESKQLMESYQATKTDAAALVDLSKEFVNTYLDTGRKLTLGGREKSNYALSMKEVDTSVKTYQKSVSQPDGSTKWEPTQKTIPSHKKLKAKSSCPTWTKIAAGV